MRIKLNGVMYDDVDRVTTKKAGETTDILYISPLLTGIENIEGVIEVYANNGFHLADDDPAKFVRTIIYEGSIRLTKTEEGYIPPPTSDAKIANLQLQINDLPSQIETGIYSDMAEAFTEGVNSIDE